MNHSLIIEKNLDYLVDNPQVFDELCAIHLNFTYPPVENIDLDANLYMQSFATNSELNEQKQFHRQDINDKVVNLNMVSNQDQRRLAKRIIMKNYPEMEVSDNEFQTLLIDIHTKSSDEQTKDYKNNTRKTVIDTLARIEEMQNDDNLNALQQTQLVDLKEYLNSIKD